MQTILNKPEAKTQRSPVQPRPPRRRRWWLGGVLAMGLTMPSALAYVDPGTGSYFFQLLIAGLAGGWFLVSNLKTKLLGWWKTSNRPSPTSSGSQDLTRP